jgi:hypothetical protein
VRAFLWTMLALNCFSLWANAYDVWSPKEKIRSESYVRKTSLVGLLLAASFVCWTAILLLGVQR